MTCVAFRDGVMAADTAAWNGSLIAGHNTKIALTPEGLAVGACGPTPLCQAVLAWAKRGANPDSFPCEGSAELDVLVCHATKTLLFQDGGWQTITGDFFAIGYAPFLMGAMAAGANAEQAIRLAARHTDMAAGRVDVIRCF